MKMAAEDVTPCHSYLYFIIYDKTGVGLKALGKDLLLFSNTSLPRTGESILEES